MCGISGSVGFDEMFCIQATRHQQKRGPDYYGVERIGNVFLAHNLLSIIGHQQQPIKSDRYTMVFNGCWYNYKHFYPYETSDTVALLKHIYKNGFNKALDDITGMFSIAVYDQEEEKLFCAVDRLGEKPFYYYHDDRFAFSSSPASLLQIKDKWQIDEDSLKTYWMLGSAMGSIWSGIKKLNGAEMLEYDIKTNKVKISTYWKPKFINDAQKRIEEVIMYSIDLVKVSDVPIHIFLSGGIDSTLVASRFKDRDAIHLDSPEYIYAKQAADKYNINLKVVHPHSIQIEEALTDYSYQSGEPSMSALIPYITSKEVSKYGRVAITANGADELFFGYNRTHDVIQDAQLCHIFRRTKHMTVPCETEFNGNRFHGRMLELNSYVQFDLNKTLDFSSMCHSLEMRSPFLNHDLVETALSIPEKEHRRNGNKTLLKNILRREGFDNRFLERPKLGFSIHYEPTGMELLKQVSLKWCIDNGYLNVDLNTLSGRDRIYTEMSALGFYFWYRTWEDKIEK